MITRFVSIAVAALVLCAGASFAAGAGGGVQTLTDIYNIAKSQDPALSSAGASLEATKEKVTQGRALELPTVNVTGSANSVGQDTTYKDKSPKLPLSGGTIDYESYNGAINASYPLFRLQNSDQYEQSKVQLNQSEIQYSITDQDLILRSAQAYFDVLLAQDTIELTRAQKKAIEEQLKQAKRMFEVGTATITDTNDAQARYDLVTSQEIAAVNDLDVKRQTLAKIIGAQPGTLAKLSGSAVFKSPEPNNMDTWTQMAEKKNLQVQAAERGLDIAGLEVQRTKHGQLPTLDLVAGYSYTSATNGVYSVGSDTGVRTVGAQVSYPLYTGGSLSSKEREAVANKNKAGFDLEGAKRQARFSAQDAFLRLTNGLAQIRALEQALVSSERSLESTTKGFQVGVRTGVDVLNSQQQLYSAKKDLVSAKYNYVLSGLKLRNAVGELSPSDVEQITNWLAKN